MKSQKLFNLERCTLKKSFKSASNSACNPASKPTAKLASNPVSKPAFTLAEVLITLGVIGVVAAITIPGLMFKYKEIQTVSRLKETYSILLQAIKLAGEDEETGLPEEWGITPGRNEENAALIGEKLKPFLKVAVDCGVTAEDTKCIAKDYYLLNGEKRINDLVRSQLILLNGTSIGLDGGDQAANGSYMYVFVDINGIAKPNKFGEDIFEFSYLENYGLVPSGHPEIGTNSYKLYCKDKTSHGKGCAYYVLHFGNMDYLRK